MIYIHSPETDAYFNMAFEEYVFTAMPKTHEYFLLWQNEKAVVVGKFQNTIEEIHADVVRERSIQVVRRLTGGGAMYQDLGNVNFSFVVDQRAETGFDLFTEPVARALRSLGVPAQINGRNDIEIEGRKFSGNSQCHRNGRTLHHGTLLYDSDLSMVAQALQVKPDKIQSKGIKSVRSRVTNISDYIGEEITVEQFKQSLRNSMFASHPLTEYQLTPADLQQIQKLRDEKYATWEWNYGSSPNYEIRKERRYPYGGLILEMTVKDSRIAALSLHGDYFGDRDSSELAQQLIGLPPESDALRARLTSIKLGDYIRGMTIEELIEAITA